MDTRDNGFQGDFPFSLIRPQKTPKMPDLLAVNWQWDWQRIHRGKQIAFLGSDDSSGPPARRGTTSP
jgi:hypothetical protein